MCQSLSYQLGEDAQSGRSVFLKLFAVNSVYFPICMPSGLTYS